MNDEIDEIRKELKKITERNSRVEIDKAWETSLSRRIILAALTYLSISLYMSAINIDRAWLNAIVPTIGFMLSTLTLPFFKEIWISRHIK